MQLTGNVQHYDASLRQGGIYSKSLGGVVRFQASSLVRATPLGPGDLVQFQLGHINGVGQAVNIVLVSKAPAPPAPAPIKRVASDKDECHACHKQMVPRMVLSNGRPERSFCPFCGAAHRNFREVERPGVLYDAGSAVAGSLVGGLLASFISF